MEQIKQFKPLKQTENTEQIERIMQMEEVLDEAGEAVSALSRALNRYVALQPALQSLAAYYSSSQWMQDFEDDSAGRLPDTLKRGVLSEDAIYDLLHENEKLMAAVQELAKNNFNYR